MKAVVFATILFALRPPLAAQWVTHPTPAIPRTADGKPNLTAPAPRTADGKPDLSGLWQRISLKYDRNITADLKPAEIQPWAQGWISAGFRSAVMLRSYFSEILCHRPDRSGLPSAVRGAGAVRFGLPSAVRGMAGVGCVTHCAASGGRSANKIVAKTKAFIRYLLRTIDLCH